ncbi:MAG TPA: hypothetical protein VK576_01620 [Thermoleophilia bacterium]|nr:hypothetical protein [Thermoleophilia bacterium]
MTDAPAGGQTGPTAPGGQTPREQAEPKDRAGVASGVPASPAERTPAATQRPDPYLKSMLLGLIEDSYLQTGTFTQFAAEILQVIAYAATVPVAFTEGFLRAYLAIDRVVESDDGVIKIIPKADATEEDWIRDVDALTAQVDPSAVFNPVVRSKLTAVHEASSRAMKYDLNTLTEMDDTQLMDVLRQMQKESEELQRADEESGAADASRDYIRAKLDTIRKNVRAFQAQQQHSLDVVDQGLHESAKPASETPPDGEPA